MGHVGQVHGQGGIDHAFVAHLDGAFDLGHRRLGR